MDKDRKTVIADAAIALLAHAGAKGLTHRAVDAEAGLPAGSTSAYCRTRDELLALTLLRHAALDMQDLLSDAQRAGQSDGGLDDFMDLLAARVADWSSAPKRARLIARFELFMIASRDPALAEVVSQQRQQFLSATKAALSRAGLPDAAKRAPMLVSMVDGILMDQVRANGPPLLSPVQQKAMFRMVLGA